MMGQSKPSEEYIQAGKYQRWVCLVAGYASKVLPTSTHQLRVRRKYQGSSGISSGSGFEAVNLF